MKNKPIYKALITLFLSLTLFIIPLVSWAATYYVDATTGNDNNDGLLPSTAWKTIAKVNAASFSPGDHILFKKGKVWREQLTVPSSGEAGNPIKFGAYGNGNNPMISGANLVIGWETSGRDNLYRVSSDWNTNQVFEDGFRLRKIIWKTDLSTTYASMSAGTWTYDGSSVVYVWCSDDADPDTHTMELSKRDNAIDLDGKNYITIEGLIAEKSNGDMGGIWCSDGTDITIENCTIRYNWSNGVYTKADNTTISNCAIHHNCSDAGGGAAGIACWSNAGTISNLTVTKCTVYSNGITTTGSNTVDGVRPNRVDGGIIEYNHIYDQNSGNGDSADNVHIGEASNITVRYNLLEDCGNGNVMIVANSDNVVIHNNILKNSSRWGIGVTSTDGLLEFYNNTIVDNGYVGIWVDDSDSAGMIIKNNIAISTDQEAFYQDSGATPAHITLDYNCWYNTTGTLIRWDGTNYTLAQFSSYQSASGQDGNSIAQDPLHTDPSNDDFTLQFSSPCIDAGVDVGLLQDYSGLDIPQGKGADIGAFELKEKIEPPKKLRVITK